MPDLRINIGARLASNFQGTLQEARQQFASLARNVNDVSRQFTGMSVGELALDHLREKFAELALGPIASFVVGIGAINTALSLMDRASAEAAEGLERFRKVEDIQATFEPLLGGVSQARSRLAELSQFAADTPFELPEVAAASKTLEVLTRGALSTGDGLRLVGDVAASTGMSFQEIAGWVGRLYDGLQSGRPVGEAMARLQEMGVISGTTRARLEGLQKAGAAGNDVWQAAYAELNRTSGAMSILSQTITGLRSTLEDAKSAMYRAFAASMVDQEKEAVQGATEAIEAMTPIAEHLGDVLADLSVPDAPGQWFTIFDTGLKKVIAGAAQAKGTINGMITAVAALTVGFIAFAAASAGNNLLALATKAKVAVDAINAMRLVQRSALLEWSLWPPTILANVRTMTAKLAVDGAVTASTRAQAIAVVLARTAWASFTGTLAAARGVLLAFVASPVGWIVTAATAMYLLVKGAERAAEAMRALYEEGNTYTDAAAKATDGIITTTDRLTRLAAAYARLKKAREDLAKAPKGSEEEQIRRRNVVNAQVEVRQQERMDERTLKPGDDRKAAEDALAKIKEETREKGMDALEKLANAQKKLNELKYVQHALDEQSAHAIRDAGKERLDALSREENARRTAYDAAQAADAAEEARLRQMRSGQRPGGMNLPENFDAQTAADDIQKRRKNREETEGRAIDMLTKEREGLPGASDTARTAAAQGRVKVAEANKEAEALQEAAEAELKKQADAARAARTARNAREDALTTRGIDRAEARSRISPQAADNQRIQLLEKQQKRALDEAGRLTGEYWKKFVDGDRSEASKDKKEAIDRRKEADALGFQIEDLRNPVAQKQNAVADSLQKVGGGGNAFYAGSGNNKTESLLEQLNKSLGGTVPAIQELQKITKNAKSKWG